MRLSQLPGGIPRDETIFEPALQVIPVSVIGLFRGADGNPIVVPKPREPDEKPEPLVCHQALWKSKISVNDLTQRTMRGMEWEKEEEEESYPETCPNPDVRPEEEDFDTRVLDYATEKLTKE